MSIIYETHMEFILDQVYEMEKNHMQEIIDNNQIAQFEYIKQEADRAWGIGSDLPDDNAPYIIEQLEKANTILSKIIPQHKERHWRILRNKIKQAIKTNNETVDELL